MTTIVELLFVVQLNYSGVRTKKKKPFRHSWNHFVSHIRIYFFNKHKNTNDQKRKEKYNFTANSTRESKK